MQPELHRMIDDRKIVKVDFCSQIAYGRVVQERLFRSLIGFHVIGYIIHAGIEKIVAESSGGIAEQFWREHVIPAHRSNGVAPIDVECRNPLRCCVFMSIG